ncbi:MAG: hypothetical protein V3T66_02005, partial [Alphaproteobacteria bacterium]
MFTADGLPWKKAWERYAPRSGVGQHIMARAFPGQIEPFDRDDFAPRLGALRMAMRGIGKDAQRRLGAKA